MRKGEFIDRTIARIQQTTGARAESPGSECRDQKYAESSQTGLRGGFATRDNAVKRFGTCKGRPRTNRSSDLEPLCECAGCNAAGRATHHFHCQPDRGYRLCCATHWHEAGKLRCFSRTGQWSRHERDYTVPHI